MQIRIPGVPQEVTLKQTMGIRSSEGYLLLVVKHDHAGGWMKKCMLHWLPLRVRIENMDKVCPCHFVYSFGAVRFFRDGMIGWLNLRLSFISGIVIVGCIVSWFREWRFGLWSWTPARGFGCVINLYKYIRNLKLSPKRFVGQNVD